LLRTQLLIALQLTGNFNVPCVQQLNCCVTSYGDRTAEGSSFV